VGLGEGCVVGAGVSSAAGVAEAIVVNEKGTSKKRRGVMLPILQLGFGGGFVRGVGCLFDFVAAGDVGGLDGAEDEAVVNALGESGGDGLLVVVVGHGCHCKRRSYQLKRRFVIVKKFSLRSIGRIIV